METAIWYDVINRANIWFDLQELDSCVEFHWPVIEWNLFYNVINEAILNGNLIVRMLLESLNHQTQIGSYRIQ